MVRMNVPRMTDNSQGITVPIEVTLVSKSGEEATGTKPPATDPAAIRRYAEQLVQDLGVPIEVDLQVKTDPAVDADNPCPFRLAIGREAARLNWVTDPGVPLPARILDEIYRNRSLLITDDVATAVAAECGLASSISLPSWRDTLREITRLNLRFDRLKEIAPIATPLDADTLIAGIHKDEALRAGVALDESQISPLATGNSSDSLSGSDAMTAAFSPALQSELFAELGVVFPLVRLTPKPPWREMDYQVQLNDVHLPPIRLVAGQELAGHLRDDLRERLAADARPSSLAKRLNAISTCFVNPPLCSSSPW